jgi:hypothetical protein
MQALSGGSEGGGRGRAAPVRALGSGGAVGGGLLAGGPSLATVLEHGGEQGPPPSLFAHPSQQQQQQQQQDGEGEGPAPCGPPGLGRGPRRSASEPSLAEVQAARCARDRPRWLAQALAPRPPPRGFGLASAAPLQDLACRQLCAALAAQCGGRQGGRGLPAGAAEALVQELGGHLPEEVAARIGRELRLLASPPPPTKLSLPALCKAAALAGGAAEAAAKGLVPAWAEAHVAAALGGARDEAELLQWQPTEVGRQRLRPSLRFLLWAFRARSSIPAGCATACA